MESTSVTFEYNGSKYTCNLAEIDTEYVYLALDLPFKTRQEGTNFENSMDFDSENPTKLTIDSVEIYSNEELLRAIAYYVKTERPYYFCELLEAMRKMRKDYVFIAVDVNAFTTSNVYKASIENTLMLDGVSETRRPFNTIRIIELDSGIYFSSDRLDFDYRIVSRYANLVMLEELITGQNVLEVLSTSTEPGSLRITFAQNLSLIHI